MEKRKIIFRTTDYTVWGANSYDTAAHGWTLTKWKLSAPEPKTKYLEKPNGDGAWDLSTTLTDGIIRYKNRSLEASFECSEGTRMEREALIRDMVNRLDGMETQIILPDDDAHYLQGRLRVTRDYNDLAHAKVNVTATCDPWKYARDDKCVILPATETPRDAVLVNGGRRVVVPNLSGGPVTIVNVRTGVSYELRTSGTATQWHDLLLYPGENPIIYSGTGPLMVAYREAVLE